MLKLKIRKILPLLSLTIYGAAFAKPSPFLHWLMAMTDPLTKTTPLALRKARGLT
ncbi:hypothetical protein H6G82_21035 [Planktothricoides sp. FACHB-1261]|nr:hypothetical protein [Planktothricoides raciborskii FACHB-1261]